MITCKGSQVTPVTWLLLAYSPQAPKGPIDPKAVGDFRKNVKKNRVLLQFMVICIIILAYKRIGMEEPEKKMIGLPMRYLKGIFILLFLCSQVWGLDPAEHLDRYLVNQWKSSDGLPSNTILSIAQTGDGYLWFATTKGLVRYDGITFTPVDFVSSRENDGQENPPPDALWVDKEGVLWIGSSAGLTSYRYQTGEFHTYTAADGLSKDRIRRIRNDLRGDIWISFFASYLNRFSKGTFTKFNDTQGLKAKKINAIIEDKKGNLLVGSREYGVFIFRDGKFSPFPVPGLDKLDIIDMHEDSRGTVWIGTNNGLFRVTDRGTEKYSSSNGLSNDYIISILEDSGGNLWFGTLKGLNRLKKNQDGPPGFESLPGEVTVLCLFEDNEHSLWIGTNEEGIKRLKESKFTYFEPLNAYPGETFLSLYEDSRGDTWIGTFSGRLFRFHAGVLREADVPGGLNGAGITAIAEDTQGNLWLGTIGKGIFKRKNNIYTQFTTQDGLADNLVTSIFRDSRGNLWFSTFDGVSLIRAGNNSIETLNSQNGLSGKVAHNVYEINPGDTWIAADKGVTVLKAGSTAKENIIYYLQGVDVTCIYEDITAPQAGGVIWLATHGAGFKRLSLPDGKVFSFATGEGMASNYLYQFFIDLRGNFWLMSNSGILRVSKAELELMAAGKAGTINCISYGLSDGLRSLEFDNEFSRHSALKTEGNEFWFDNKGGIAIVNPEKIQIDKIPPPVVIEDVFFNQEPVSLHGENLTFKGITEIDIHFTAPSFLSPAKIKFKYRLEGVDPDWVNLPVDSPRAARYRELTPGTYSFSVTACNAEGVWNPMGASISFTLEPRFYETAAFKILLAVLLSGLLAASFYIYKKWPLKKQEKYKGSPLTSQYADECIKKLRHLMEVEKIHRDAELSLQFLAEKLAVSPHLLSQILNEKLNRNFSDFINFYRIEEAKEILCSPQGTEQKIIAVAFDVGFNTKVAFYNAFKKYTGMTPAEYRKKSEESKEL